MTLEGAKVLAVCEIMSYSSGLRRNIEQCLNDFDIPLYLGHTVTKIEGDKRVTGVVIAKVDENKRPIAGTERRLDCDTVLFSVGLIPENELTKEAGIPISPNTKGALVDQTRETKAEGVFACGNVLQVHDLVDFVSEEGEIAGKYAAQYALSGREKREYIDVCNGNNVSYVCPQRLAKGLEEKVKLFFRVTQIFKKAIVRVKCGDETLLTRKKQIVTPGEMETLVLPSTSFAALSKPLTVSIEEEK